MQQISVSREIAGRTLSIETGTLAKLAAGSVSVQYGDTVVFAAVCRANPREGIDFFPLQVEYRERRAAAGKFPGGFIKREGRPSDREVLIARLIDRPLRPLFPVGFRDEVQLQISVFSFDGQNDPDMLAGIASSACVHISDIPFIAPTAHVKVASVDGKFVYCVNVECADQLRGRIVHMTSRRALDIEGLGPEKVDQLVAAGLLRQTEDLFTLPQREAEITALDGWGPRSVAKLRQQLEQAKKPALARFLNALGIRHVGEQTAKDLAAHFGTLEALANASEEDIDEVHGVGTEVAHAVHAFFANAGNQRFLTAVQAAGVEVATQARAVDTATGPFAGMVFCFTGTMTMKRDAAKALVEARGGKVADAVTKAVTHVVAGANAGSKLAKAEKLGLQVLDEAAFEKLVPA